MSIGHSIRVFFSGGEVAYQAKNVIREQKRIAELKNGNLSGALQVYYATSEDSDAVKLAVYKRTKHLYPFISGSTELKGIAKMIIREQKNVTAIHERWTKVSEKLTKQEKRLQEHLNSVESLKLANGKKGFSEFTRVELLRKERALNREINILQERKDRLKDEYDLAVEAKQDKIGLFIASVNGDALNLPWKKIVAESIVKESLPFCQINHEKREEAPVAEVPVTEAPATSS